MKVILIALCLALCVTACARVVPPAATSTPSPVSSPSPRPEITSTASLTASPQVTASATSMPIPAGLPELACKLNWQSPHHGSKVEPRADFTVQWNVTNTGSTTWDPGAVDLVFVGGTRMFLQSPIALEASVAPGESVTLKAEMKALRNTSGYVTNFALRRGEVTFCTVGISILVQTNDPPQWEGSPRSSE